MEYMIPWILLGESYNGNSVRLWNHSVRIKKYQQAFWRSCQGTVAIFSSNLVGLDKKYIFIMKTTPIKYRSASKGKFSEPPPKSNFSSGCKLRPGLIAMVRAQPFSGLENENPCNHLLEFEEMCLCLSTLGMTQETLRWKLFPFTLTGKAKQWYTHVIWSMNGDWEELKDKFCLEFSTLALYQMQSLTLSSTRRSL